MCDKCGRRFGVNSNLNRHVKRCTIRSTSTTADIIAIPTPPTAALSANHTTPAPITATALTHTALRATKRRHGSPTPLPSPFGDSNSHPRPSIKRRRRAPSPSQWVPPSLLGFNLFPIEFSQSTAVPLLPVFPHYDGTEWSEERDSGAEGVESTPYHPCSWNGTLPGPALGSIKRCGKEGLIDGPGFVMGRLVLT